MDDKFRDIEDAFSLMKRRFRGGEISQREFIDSLKRLRIKDDEGRFWMIGAQSGKWYFFDGKDWVQSAPPSIKERKAICIYCGYENDIEAAECAGCGGRFGEEARTNTCPECGAEVDPESRACPRCAGKDSGKTEPLPATVSAAEESSVRDGEIEYAIRSVQPLSLLLFWGGIGIVAGILTGMLAGATEFLPGLAGFFPSFLKDMQGKLVGGLISAALGGIIGFLLFGLAGWLTALLANGVLSFIGGLKIRLTKAEKKVQEEETPSL
jgi:hypothetical protein